MQSVPDIERLIAPYRPANFCPSADGIGCVMWVFPNKCTLVAVPGTISPIGIVLEGSGQIHLNLVSVDGDRNVCRFEPHAHVTLSYDVHRLDAAIVARTNPASYTVRYGRGVGTNCVEDAFAMLAQK